jgi:hypothetical protein
VIQRHELEAWLGDDHGLTGEQIDDLMEDAEEIAVRYPDPDDQEERDAALFAAYELMTRDAEDVIAEQAGRIVQGRTMELRGLAGARQTVITLDRRGKINESDLARRLGVDRMAVRGWLGKR